MPATDCTWHGPGKPSGARTMCYWLLVPHTAYGTIPRRRFCAEGVSHLPALPAHLLEEIHRGNVVAFMDSLNDIGVETPL